MLYNKAYSARKVSKINKGDIYIALLVEKRKSIGPKLNHDTC